MPRTVKIALEIDAKLYQEPVSVAKENVQSQSSLLERALEHYLPQRSAFAAPSEA
jgi:hypothetical protein